MFNIIDVDNLFTISEISSKFINISDIIDFIQIKEVNK